MLHRISLALIGAGLVLVGFLGGSPSAQASSSSINSTINFQGRLLTNSGAVVADGSYNIEFKLYKNGNGASAGDSGGSPAGTLLWTEDWVYGTGSPDNRVVIKNGYFSVQLGSITALPSNLSLDESNLWLSMNIETPLGATSQCTGFSSGSPAACTGGDGEMTPMKQLGAAPYAINAANANQVNSYGLSNNFLNLAAPSGISAANGAAGSVPGTVCYTVTATNANGETVAANNSGTVTPGGTHVVNVTWSQVTGATGYKIYRNTSCAFTSGSLFLTTIASGSITTYQDTATSTSAGLPPTTVTGGTVDVQAWNSQTANLLQLQNSAATNVLTVDGSGDEYVAGVVTVAGGASQDITTAGAATATAITLQPGASSGGLSNGPNLNLDGGGASGTTSVQGGTVAIQGGSATGASGTRNGGNVTVDAGTGATTNGSITIGGTAVGTNTTGVTVNVATDATASGKTDTINIGTGNGAGGSGTAKAVNIASGTPGGTEINTVLIGSTANASTTTIQGGTTGTGIALTTGTNGSIALTANGAGTVGLYTNSSSSGTLIKTLTNSVTALQVEDLSGNQALTVDTSTNSGQGQVVLGEASTDRGTLVFDSVGGSGTITLQAPATNPTSYVLALPTSETDNDCLQSGTTTSGITALSFGACGTSSLQGAYGNSTAEATIALDNRNSGADGLIISNAASGATTSGALLSLQNSNTGAVDGLDISSAGTGSLLKLTETASPSTVVMNVTSSGATTFKSQTNSITELQVENTDGESVFQTGTTQAVDGITNYITDSEFAAGSGACPLTDWAVVGSPTSCAQNTTTINSYDADTSLKLVTTSTANQGVSTTAFTSTITPANPSYYTASFYAEQTSGTPLAGSNLEAVTAGDAATGTCTIAGQASNLLSSTGFEQVVCTLSYASSSAITSLSLETTGTVTADTVYISNVQFQVASGSGGTVSASQIGQLNLRGVITSPIAEQTNANSSTALQIQNAAGATLFNVNTNNTNINTSVASNTGITSAAATRVNSLMQNTYEGSPVSSSQTVAAAPHALGDLMIVSVAVYSNTTTLTSITAGTGGVSNWVKVASNAYSASTTTVYMYEGTVTSIGCGANCNNTTVNFSTSGTNSEIVSQEFTAGTGPNTTWGIAAENTDTNPNSGTAITFPTLTSGTSTGEVYYGYSVLSSTGRIDPGTPGFHWYTTPTDQNQIGYNSVPLTPNTSYAPASLSAANGYANTIGVIMAPTVDDTVGVNGSTIIGGATSSAAFQVQNSAGGTALNVDTANNLISLNTGYSGNLAPWQINNDGVVNYDWQGASAQANGYVYVMSGDDNGSVDGKVYYGKASTDGQLASWGTAGTVPTSGSTAPVAFQQGVASNGFLYELGGCTTTACTAAYSNYVQYAQINHDGTLSTFQATTPLPATVAFGTAVAANGYIYVIGGRQGGSTVGGNVYYGKINADGTISSWTTVSSALTVNAQNLSCVYSNSYILCFGGDNAGSPATTVQTAQVSPTNGSFVTNFQTSYAAQNTSDTQLTTGMDYMSADVVNGYVYLIGGSTAVYSSWAPVNTTIYAQINQKGFISGSWTTSSSGGMPQNFAGGFTAAVNGYIYAMGGVDTSVPNVTVSIFYASTSRIQIDGSLDLVGSMTGSLAEGGDGTSGSLGGSLTAGNTEVAGTLQVADQANFNSSVAINGNLDVGSSLGVDASNVDIASMGTNADAINIGSNGTSHTINIGNGTGASNTITLGSITGGSTILQGGTTNQTISSSGDTVKTNTNSSSAFEVQNANSDEIQGVSTANPTTDVTNNQANNEINNSSFEGSTGTTGWSALGAGPPVLAQTNMQSYQGTDSMQVTTQADANTGAEYALTSGTTAVANTAYYLSMWVRSFNNGGNWTTMQIGYDSGGANTDCNLDQTVVWNGWTQYNCLFTTGATVTSPYIYIEQTDATARVFYVDGVQLQRWSILSNSSMEQAFTASDWQGYDRSGSPAATVTQVSTQHFDGTHSAQITTGSATNVEGIQHDITLEPNTTYTMSWVMLATVAVGNDLETGYYNGTTYTPCQTGQPVNTGGWAGYACTFTTPSSNSGTPFMYMDDNTGKGVYTWFVDAVQLNIGDFLNNEYQDGQVELTGTIDTPVTLQNASDSTSAFTMQDAEGNSMLNIDTVDKNITFLTGTGGGVRFRANSFGVNIETGGADLYLSGWSNAAMTNTQFDFLHGEMGSGDLYVGDGFGTGGWAGGPTLLNLDQGQSSGDPVSGFTGGMYYNAITNQFRCDLTASNYYVDCLGGIAGASSAASVALHTCGTSGTACTAFSTSGTAIPAGYCQTGKIIHVYAAGTYGSTASTPTLSFEFAFGTSTTLTSDTAVGSASPAGAIGAGVAQSTDPWTVNFSVNCYSTTSWNTEGTVQWQNSTTAATTNVTTSFANTSTTEATTAENLYLFPIWSTSNASNTITMDQWIVSEN